LTMTMDLYISDESTWDLEYDFLPTLDSESSAFNTDDAIITATGNSRTYDVSLDVSVCDLSGTEVLTVVKGIQDQSVRYFSEFDLQISLGALCPSTSIGTLPITGTSTLYSDSALSNDATEYYLGDTVYFCAAFSTYGDVASISLDSLTLTQSSTDTDVTSDTSTVTSPSPSPTQLCISFPLPLDSSTLSADVNGLSTTITGVYSLTYTDSSRRRLQKTETIHSLDHQFSLRSSNCILDSGKIAHLGEIRTLPCPYYGLQRQQCQNFEWHTVSESCSNFYVGQMSAFEQFGLLISVSTLVIFSASFLCVAPSDKLL